MHRQDHHAPAPTRRTPSLRRRTLLTGTLTALAVGAVASACGEPVWEPDVAFDTPLPVPPLAGSRVEDGVRVFSLHAREGTHRFRPGMRTPTWGYDGDYLGPTLRARVGERVRVHVHNGLAEETSVHWHGMHLPAAMDGGPHQPIAPGGDWSPEWEVRQAPATLWYHPHPHGRTEEHVARGLAGMFILDPPAHEPVEGLPGEYGVDDLPLVIQDKKLDTGGQLVLDDEGNEIGLLGNLFLVNGVAGGIHQVTTDSVRLRLLNGSTARTYQVGLADRRDMALVASDGGLLESPVDVQTVRLSPGERAEVVVRFRPGERVRLRSFAPHLGDVVVPRVFGGEDEVDLVEFRAAARLARSPALPATLTTVERPSAASAARRREFVLEDRDINGRGMDMDRIDATVTLGDTEIWSVRSRNPFPHNFHVHDVQFQVLAVDGRPPPPELAGRKDTVYLEPHVTYDLVMRFEDYADPRHPYMFHCHLLLHEDDGMMGQFVVVEPGRAGEVGVPAPADHQH